MFETQNQAGNPLVFAPVETKRASEVIYEQIVDMIVSGKLTEGDRLPSEKNLMDMTRRSRPTVREALRMLERAGYIQTVPGSNGAIVKTPGVLSVLEPMGNLLRSNAISSEEMAEYREVNDIQMARWAALRHTEADIEAMEDLLEQAELMLNDYEAYRRLDPKFHALIARAAKNEVAYIITYAIGDCIIETIRRYQDKMSEQGRTAMNEKVLMMHRHLLNAIASGDPDEAERSMRFHLDVMRKDLFSHPEEEEDERSE